MESLVQVTVVAGPPVEIQVRVISSESNVTLPDNIVMSPIYYVVGLYSHLLSSKGVLFCDTTVVLKIPQG